MFIFVNVICIRVYKEKNTKSEIKVGVTLILGLYNIKHLNIFIKKTSNRLKHTVQVLFFLKSTFLLQQHWFTTLYLVAQHVCHQTIHNPHHTPLSFSHVLGVSLPFFSESLNSTDIFLQFILV